MGEGLIREKIGLNELNDVSGGTSVEVSSDGICCKPGCFKVLENKEDDWRQNGSPEKCRYCWHLKYDNVFYCDT